MIPITTVSYAQDLAFHGLHVSENGILETGPSRPY